MRLPDGPSNCWNDRAKVVRFEVRAGLKPQNDSHEDAGQCHAAKGSAMAWMSSIVRYRALDMLRSQRRDATFKTSDSDYKEETVSDVPSFANHVE